jgi:hypothetical protein
MIIHHIELPLHLLSCNCRQLFEELVVDQKLWGAHAAAPRAAGASTHERWAADSYFGSCAAFDAIVHSIVVSEGTRFADARRHHRCRQARHASWAADSYFGSWFRKEPDC